MSDERPVPTNIATCPECDAELVCRVMSWDETGRPEELEVDCIGDPEGKHRWWQSDWQPVIDSVRAWINRNNPPPNTDREAFLRALEANEDDVTTRMVYADWLDENGQPEEAERQRKWNGAKEWLVNYAVRVSPYDAEYGNDHAYRKFMESVVEGSIFYHGSDCHGAYEVEEPDELYANLTILLGRQIGPDSFESFSCSC